ncbi:MAG: TIGR03118 family protein [Phycisphaerae bacterium]|nr:TIGR03118 family protein [Phycisphaerae bacterium]
MKARTSILLGSLCLVLLSGPPSCLAATTNVKIVDFGFEPADVTVKVGDTVTWTNTGSFAHTTTSGTTTGGVRHPDGLWDSGSLFSGQTFSHTFTKAGVFPYYCTPHYSMMVGTVTVQTVANVPPAVLIVSPANGATFISPANVTIQAGASDTDGAVMKVEFFDGSSSLGSVTTAPYAQRFTLYPGTHPLTAVATDNAGAAATSATVTVTVNTMPIPDPIPAHIVKGDITIELQTIVDDLTAPLSLAVPDDGSKRMFVCDQVGLAWVVANGSDKLPTPLLDVRSRLVTFGNYDERGLLGLAIHPDFAHHPLIYTYTSEPIAGTADFVNVMPAGVTNNCQSVIAEWRIDSANPNQVDPASRREILRIDKPQSNHNGGTLRFGPDGYLYISLGDGGRANDVADGHVPGGNAQNLQRIYGKLLRIDVNGANSANGKYGIPKDNPFVGQNAVQEIYAYGLRNPFTYSFDSLTGDLYVGDAGQNNIEEVDLIAKGGNYGWNVKEGTFWFDSVSANLGKVVTGPVRPVPASLIDPIAEYDHDEGSVVIGGFVYRGVQVPVLQARYVFGDWGSFAAPSARLFYLEPTFTIKELRIGLADRPTGFWLRGFGQDADGELYVFGSTALGPSGTTGRMLKIVPSLPTTYLQHNLVSDLPSVADRVDPNLINPWGIAFGPTTPFWIADNHTGVSSIYDGNGVPTRAAVAIPGPAGGAALGAPTGIVFNATTDFALAPGQPAKYLFATEDGTIAGWSTGAAAVLKADLSVLGTVYKGLALGSSSGKNYLYAANFSVGRVDVFDANFAPVALAGTFTDPNLPAGFAPFNVQNVGGKLYVTYVLQDAEHHDDVPGPGNGFVNTFDTSGQLLQRFASRGLLNSPWGVVLAPAGFGGFGGALLVGNFGDGRINAFNPTTGAWLGAIQDASGAAISIQGLWGLTFGNGGPAGGSQTLYFTAGIAGTGTVEDHGLFGSLTPIARTVTSAPGGVQ